MAVTYSGSGIPGIGINSPAALAALPQATWKPTGAIPDFKTFEAQKPAMLGTILNQGAPGFYGGNGAWQVPAPIYSNPQDKANIDAWQLWGHQNNIFPGGGGGFMETLSNKIIPAAIQGTTMAGIGAGLAGAAGVGPLAAGSSTAAPVAGATTGATGTGVGASGLGGASGAVGATAVPAGTGLAGGITGASGPALGAGGLGTAVGAGSTLAGGVGLPELVSGATTGSAAGSAAGGAAGTATGGTSSGFGGFMNSLFGPGATAPTAASLSAIGLGGALGQTILDLYEANKRRQTAGNAAGLADPFASQRGQYQTQLANLMANPNSIVNDPSYKFRLEQGQQALERSNVAKGFLSSGNMPLDLVNYGQGAASQELNNQKSFLANLAGANVGNPGAAANAYGNGMNGSLAQTYQGLSQLGPLAGQIYKNYSTGSGALV